MDERLLRCRSLVFTVVRCCSLLTRNRPAIPSEHLPLAQVANRERAILAPSRRRWKKRLDDESTVLARRPGLRCSKCPARLPSPELSHERACSNVKRLNACLIHPV